jgi:hypothetical protein
MPVEIVHNPALSCFCLHVAQKIAELIVRHVMPNKVAHNEIKTASKLPVIASVVFDPEPGRRRRLSDGHAPGI